MELLRYPCMEPFDYTPLRTTIKIIFSNPEYPHRVACRPTTFAARSKEVLQVAACRSEKPAEVKGAALPGNLRLPSSCSELQTFTESRDIPFRFSIHAHWAKPAHRSAASNFAGSAWDFQRIARWRSGGACSHRLSRSACFSYLATDFLACHLPLVWISSSDLRL